MKINQNFIDNNLENFKTTVFSLSLASVICIPFVGFMAYASGIPVRDSLLLPLIIIAALVPLFLMAGIIPTILEYDEPVFIKEVLSEDSNVHTIESVKFSGDIIAHAPSLSLTNELSNLLSESTVKVKFAGIDKKYDLPYSEYLALDGKARLPTQTVLDIWNNEKVITLDSPKQVD